MTRRVSSAQPWEPIVGYSRAVAAGDHVWVSGCTSTVDGEVVHRGDVYEQTRLAIANGEQALVAIGASLSDVVRTRMFVLDITRWEEIGRAHGEAFAEVLPATSMVQVSALIDPAMDVEIEMVAYVPGIGAATSPSVP